jgi:hypothetical protein
MLTFKQFLAEMQASNDNPEDIHIKKAHNDSIHAYLNPKTSASEKKFHLTKINALRHNLGHTPLNNKMSAQEIRGSLLESKSLRAMIAATMLAASPAQAGGMAHELPVYSHGEINKPNLNPELIAKSKAALEKAQDEYDESMPGEHLSNAIDSHNNGDINAAFEHLKQHNKKMINTKQSSPMS